MQSAPRHLAELTSLRFFAAFYVVLFHFQPALPFDPGAGTALLSRGETAVDLFFLLSGFILAHVYLGQIEAGAFSIRDFLASRLARIYPMHLATLAACVMLYGMFAVFGLQPKTPQKYDLAAVPSHLLLLHGWGLEKGLSWNYPSWSVSAEWAAYLLFAPACTLIVTRMRSAVAAVALAAAFLLVLARASVEIDGAGLFQRTWDAAFLRAVPEFLLGVALFRLHRERPIAPALARIALAATAALLAAMLHTHAPDIAIVGMYAVLILLLGRVAEDPAPNFLRSRPIVYLGTISYSIYLVHALVFTVWFNTLDRLAPDASPVSRGFAFAAALAVVLAVAAAGFHLVEAPGRKHLRLLLTGRYGVPPLPLARPPH